MQPFLRGPLSPLAEAEEAFLWDGGQIRQSPILYLSHYSLVHVPHTQCDTILWMVQISVEFNLHLNYHSNSLFAVPNV